MLPNYLILKYESRDEIHTCDLCTTGDQLLHEDIAAGYVDYIDYTIEKISTRDYDDGGIIMFEKYVTDLFETAEQVAAYYHKYLFDDAPEDYVIMSETDYETLMGHDLDERGC